MNSGENSFYSVNNAEVETVSKYEGLSCKVNFVIFKTNVEKKLNDVLYFYSGNGVVVKNGEQWIINYQIKKKEISGRLVKKFISALKFDLVNSFENDSYVIIEDANVTYPNLEIEKRLSSYSQFNQNCKRPMGIMEILENTSEFQRDYEQLVYAKTNRELMSKPELTISAIIEDHGTHMTHILEVDQIARAIAIGLNLNVNLTEAIVLAHDLARTQSGQQKEKMLGAILKNKIEVIENASGIMKPTNEIEPNFLKLRVINYLEEKFIEFEGLDVSYQVLEGVLKHTGVKVKNCDACNDNHVCDSKCFDLKEFFPNDNLEQLYPQYQHSTTLEGQIVAIAEEISQCGRDLHDTFPSDFLYRRELTEYQNLRKITILKTEIAKIDEQIQLAHEKNLEFVEVNELQHSIIVASVIGFFINDVINCSKDNIESFKEDDFYRDYHRFSKILLSFSEEGKILII